MGARGQSVPLAQTAFFAALEPTATSCIGREQRL